MKKLNKQLAKILALFTAGVCGAVLFSVGALLVTFGIALRQWDAVSVGLVFMVFGGGIMWVCS